ERGERLDPEALRHTSSRAFSEAQTVVEHHGGSLETVASDGLTAVFGLPLVHEDDALRGIRAADEIRGSLIGLAETLARERETRRLHDAFEQALSDRSCQLFTLLGPAGVGKSRLIQEFLGDVSDQAVVARGRCLPYGEGITYWPVLEAVKDVAGLDDAES